MGRESSRDRQDISDIHRISSLADGVFAIVMTLLVLGVEVPQVPDEMIAARRSSPQGSEWGS